MLYWDRRRSVTCGLAMLFVLADGGELFAREPARLEGIVRDQGGTPVSRATVVIRGTSMRSVTDDTGAYRIDGLTEGTRVFVILEIGSRRADERGVALVGPTTVFDFTVAKDVALNGTPTFESDVTVTATLPPLSTSTESGKIVLTPDRIATLPSLGARDIFRALQLLPGVSGSEASSGLYVRGGTPDQNLVQYDGFTVYQVDHLFGYFSAFNMDAVEQVELSKGGFGAEHGGRLSSLTEIHGKSSAKRMGGSVGASLLSVEGFFQAPLGDFGSFVAAGRRSYQSPLYDSILTLFNSQTSTKSDTPRPPGFFVPFTTFLTVPTSTFWDANAKLTLHPSSDDQVAVSFYQGADGIDNSRELSIPDTARVRLAGQGVNVDQRRSIRDTRTWSNQGLSAVWNRVWSPSAQTHVTLAYSEFENTRDRTSTSGQSRGFVTEDNSLDDWTVALDAPVRLTANHLLKAGLQVTRNDVAYVYEGSDSGGNLSDRGAQGFVGTQGILVGLLNRREEGAQVSAYVQDHWTLADRLILTPGVRLTRFGRQPASYVQPRLGATFQATDAFRFKGASGVYHQFANRLIREDAVQGNRDFWALADGADIPVPSATHFAGGVSYESKNFLVDVEAFGKNFRDLTRFAPQAVATEGEDLSRFFFHGTGTARGVEVLAQKKSGRHTGWIGYTLAEVIHQFPSLSAESFPADHDRTHEVKLVESLRLGRWTVSGLWIYSTGAPYTDLVGLAPAPRRGQDAILGDRNGARLPGYHRLDLAINYDLPLGDQGRRATLALSVFNLYDRHNIWYKEFSIIQGGGIAENSVGLMGRTLNASLSVRF